MTITLANLHGLSCNGPTPDTGCQCPPVPIRRHSAVSRHLDSAAAHRERSEDLVKGIEALIVKLDAIPVIPLDVLDKYERLIVGAHAANLLRLPAYPRLGGDE